MFFELDGIINFRDLRDIKAADGKQVRGGCLFRSGELFKASERDISRLQEEFSLRHIIDFRSPDEAQERPNRAICGAKMHLLPALPPMIQPKDRMKDGPPPDADKIFPRIYRQLAETDAAQAAYRRFFDIVLAAEGAPLLWHCRQGKDRTGIAAILLLSALGVSHEDCIAEYRLTNEFMQPVYDAYCEKESVPWKREMMRIISFVYEDWLAEYFRCLDENYGGMARYLRDVLNLNDTKLEKLKSFYLIP